MITKKIAWVVGFSALSVALSAYASQEGFYIGGQAGMTNTHNQQQTLQTGTLNANGTITTPPGLGTTTVNPKNTGVGGRFFVGYNLNNFFALETGFAHYGATTYNVGTPNPPLISGNPQGKPAIQENGFDLVAKGTVPVGDFGLFGKAGVAVIRTSLAGSLTTSVVENIPTTVPPTYTLQSKTGTTNYIRPTAAIGASYDITKNWDAELTVSRVFAGGGFQSADLYSAGIAYHFVDAYCGQFLC